MDLAYLAGFFDGEGCIGIYRHRMSHYLLVQLGQNDGDVALALLEEVQARYGGKLNEQHTASGRVKLNWQATSQTAVAFLMDLLPYLRLKAEQAQLAVAWQSKRERWQGRVRGRMTARPAEMVLADQQVIQLMKMLKRHTLREAVELCPEFAWVTQQLVA